MQKKNKLVISLVVLGIIFTLIGSTFAVFNASVTGSNNVNALSYKFDITLDITLVNPSTTPTHGNNLIPLDESDIAAAISANCTDNDGYAACRIYELVFTNNSGQAVTLNGTLTPTTNTFSNLKYSTTAIGAQKSTLTAGNPIGTSPVTTGFQNLTIPTGTSTMYVMIYLNSLDGNQPIDENSTFVGKVTFVDSAGGNQLYAQFGDNVSSSINPILDTGMIPVTIANNGTVTTVSDDDSSWYNYDNKQWANAVLVKATADAGAGSHDRSYYKTNSENGNNVTVTQSDILAYYVWIPRYSYKIWTLDASSDHTGAEQTIDIKFIDKNTKDNGTQVGEYYTHPAFTFGTQELDGIWVGKFEMSHDTLSSSTTDNNLGCTSTTCTNASGLRILPNVSSLRYNDVSNMYYASRSMEQSNNVFGISNSDSHMMKNSEWGAVAYLSHSGYGINAEIRKNNYRQSSTPYLTLTGCGADTANANTSTIVTTCAIPYGTVSGEMNTYPQSTTGNISGIFDMSSGANEYVMGNYNGTIGASGFSTMPDSKYYDTYPESIFNGNNSSNMIFCTLATCGGHALNETRAWYSDSAHFVYSSGPWFYRGGFSSNSTNAGAFYSNFYNGYSYYNSSFRGVLVAR